VGLTLREGNREYFYAQLDRFFPGLKQRYIRTYGNAYELSSQRAGQLMEVLHQTCDRYGICRDNGEIFAWMRRFEEKKQEEQLCLFDY